jgi:response regulator RpfG family c-di-GMP phosphodiesterase
VHEGRLVPEAVVRIPLATMNRHSALPSSEARILAVADGYEAMTADRPYRPGMPVHEADAELRRCAGSQFDEPVVEAFLGSREGPLTELASERSVAG